MKKQTLQKVLLFLLILLLSILVMPGKVNAGNYSKSYLKSKFNEIRNTSGYRPGEKYVWNDAGYFSDYCAFGSSFGTAHTAWECHAYGLNLFDLLFQQCANCHKSSNGINDLCVGDVVRVDNDSHTLVVQNIVGDTVYYTDANWGYTGAVRWDVQTSKSALASRMSWIYHADGNDVKTLEEETIIPDEPTNIKATNQGGNTVKVTWNGVSNVDGYEVVIYPAANVERGDFSTRAASYKTTSTSYTFTISNGDYYAYVHSRIGDTWSPGGGAGSKFKVAPITGVSLNKSSVSLNVGEKTTLTATITPSDTSDSKTLTWTSSNSSVASVSSSGIVTAKSAGTTTITVKTSNGKTKTCTVTVKENSYANVSYKTHVQNVGWQSYVSNGATSGTEHKSLRLEGIKINISSNYSGTIQYRTHVQNIGWQDWKSNDAMSGTEHQSLRLEAIQIKLTGDIANYYDVYYRVHAQNFGWLDWAKNGASAGTQGYSYRLEAIQIKLVKKGSAAPGSTTRAFVKNTPSVTYTTHVQNVGWQGVVKDGATSGTEHKSLRLEGIRISLQNNGNPGGVQYSTHVQNIGWQDWKTNGAMAGTEHKSLRLEAIKIKLTGDIANEYDIYYRVHAQNFGWMGWAKNGAAAGTQGYSYRLEAIQIKLVKKGNAAPGSTANAFKQK